MTTDDEPKDEQNADDEKPILEIESTDTPEGGGEPTLRIPPPFRMPNLGITPEQIERMLFPFGRQPIIPDLTKILGTNFPKMTELLKVPMLDVYVTGMKPIQDALNANAALSKSVWDSFSPNFTSITSDIFKGLTQPALDNLLAGLRPPQTFFDQLKGLERLFVDTRKFWPDFQRWKEEQREGIEILTAHGWWPHPNWSVGIFREVVQLKKDRRLRHLDRLICDSYDEERYQSIKEAMEDWYVLPEYRERRPILRTGFNAYRRRDYISAVSVWLPQVEGVLRANTVRNGFSPNGWKGTIRKPEQIAASAEIESMIVGDFFRFFRQLYLDAQVRPSRKDFPIRRNMILHGSDLTYGRRANAMRIFLMLDTVHYFIREYEKEATDVA